MRIPNRAHRNYAAGRHTAPHRRNPATVADVPDLRSVLAGAIRAERLRSGLTQDQLAADLGWSRTVITMIEARQRAVTAEELPALCRALNVTLAQLLRDADRDDRQALDL